VALDGQGVGSWSLPPAALSLGLDLRVVAWQRGAPWSAASVSGRVPQPPAQSSVLSPFPAGALVITEFHKDPQAVADSAGEWFEVYNRSSVPLDMEGWVLSDAGSDLAVLDNQGAGIVIQPGARVVLGVNADKTTNGGVTVDAVYKGLVLSNSADEIYLSTPAGVLVDGIAYDNGVNWPDQAGRSAVLQPTQELSGNNDDGWDWCSSTTYFGAGDRGTPRLVNDFCW